MGECVRTAGQFATAFADGPGMQAEPRGGAFVAAASAQQREQPGEQASLALVEQADEAVRHRSQPRGRQRQRYDLSGAAPGGDLPPLPGRVGGAVQGASVDPDTG